MGNIIVKVKQSLKGKELTDFDSNPFFGHISRNNTERFIFITWPNPALLRRFHKLLSLPQFQVQNQIICKREELLERLNEI